MMSEARLPLIPCTNTTRGCFRNLGIRVNFSIVECSIYIHTFEILREIDYTGKAQRPELEESYRNPKPRGSAYETSDRGLALIEGCLRALPRERLAHISSDVTGLKNELRAAARRETDEVKSRLKPNSAHKVLHSTYVFQIRLHVTKVYAWRDLLEEREQKSAAYKSTKVKWAQLKKNVITVKTRFQVRCTSRTRLTS